MSYYAWIIINVLFVFCSGVYIWLFQQNQSLSVITGQLLAQAGILLFLVNVNMYFIFLVIRKSKIRKLRTTLAKLSRKMMKVHIPLGIVGTAFVTIHAIIMLIELGNRIGFFHGKLVSGYLSISFLMLTLFAGYLRHKKSSGFRKKFHRTTAFAFTVAFTIHLFFPLY
ncbi:hypothetical protein IMZ08_05660 [Bacillus luteolus]|uniref:Uncharacterized protein n=1 Tax=Litchfieldia luteola TaxID=682179 RepID=A0ABR9QGD9_9BACI|nr:hypothetical protein [Cytobacillus luteolus]MBE4907549.1 hypothetical protein [Cytobacillus luteolus]MBP1944320.1 multisubunit Na+/H+ antiporter MnhC subunit [Cytobacillus luteolus]